MDQSLPSDFTNSHPTCCRDESADALPGKSDPWFMGIARAIRSAPRAIPVYARNLAGREGRQIVSG